MTTGPHALTANPPWCGKCQRPAEWVSTRAASRQTLQCPECHQCRTYTLAELVRLGYEGGDPHAACTVP